MKEEAINGKGKIMKKQKINSVGVAIMCKQQFALGNPGGCINVPDVVVHWTKYDDISVVVATSEAGSKIFCM
jgi:hypothetical protein